MDQNSSPQIQKDERRNVAQRPMDPEVNVLSFLSNVQPRLILQALQNGAPSPQNLLLSNINSLESILGPKTKFYGLPVSNTIASHENDEANDYIHSMTQNKISTSQSPSNPVYAPVPKQIRNREPMKFIAEPQIVPNLIDVSNDYSNYIFSSQSESELAANNSTSCIFHPNTFEDENDDFLSLCGSTTFTKSLDVSKDFTTSRNGSNISDKTSAAQNLTPMCNGSELLEELPISEANQNPSNGSEIPLLHDISSRPT